MEPRHGAAVRITHWITTLSFLSLLVSGTAILIVQPNLYWGEVGNFLTPSWMDLTFLPYVSRGQSGWARHLHFMTAWICILTGLFYVVYGVISGHFRRNLLPARSDLSRAAMAKMLSLHSRPNLPAEVEFLTYNPAQRMIYLAVIFILFPAMIWTGFAMSPGLAAVFPFLVNLAGGHQSARTLHLVFAVLILSFFVVHIAMVSLNGFVNRMGSMITGRHAARKESA